MASPGELAEQHRGMIPRRVRGARVDSSLTRAPARFRALNSPVEGVGTGAATSPRARQDLTRGGDQPSSEAGPHPRGRPALEQGGTSPEGATSPRARRKSTGAVPRPSSEAEFCPSVAGLTVLVGRWDHQCCGPSCYAVVYFKRVLGSFVFCFLRK
jgi:hypothetical protein